MLKQVVKKRLKDSNQYNRLSWPLNTFEILKLDLRGQALHGKIPFNKVFTLFSFVAFVRNCWLFLIANDV